MMLALNRQGRLWLIGSLATGAMLAAFLLPPLRQPQTYHQFADSRTVLGLPNFLNVVSNGGFLAVGLLGLRFSCRGDALGKQSAFVAPSERLPYTSFFLGVLFTAFGSAWYHWRPGDATLVWDRLPMTLAFMSLLAANISERIDVRAGRRWLWPLLAMGAASVWWWRWRDNLWPYAAVQYFSLLLLGLIMALFPPRYSRSADLWLAAVLYALAKVTEALDAQIFSLTRWISGHTLKHLLAALAVYSVLRHLMKRAAINHEAPPARREAPSVARA